MTKLQFKTIGLIGNPADSRVDDTVSQLLPLLKKRGATILLFSEKDQSEHDCEHVNAAEMGDRADLLIAVGGDGTMLYATQQVAAKGIPLLGINRGRLGFLADISPDEITERVNEILDGNFVVDHRAILQTHLTSNKKTNGIALNDVVVQRDGDARLIELETRINGIYVNTHAGDGLIIATPTGSTAYALSGGGPILEPSLNALVLVPICPHTLSDRPIVVNANSKIEIRVKERAGATATINCDGRPIGVACAGDKLHVGLASFTATLLHPTGHDYFRILRNKLSWGRGLDRQP